MQGWQPMEADSAMGRSMTSWTALSGSFMRPRTLTEPGVISRYCLHIRRVGERRARHAELLRQVLGLEDLLPFQHEQVELCLLPVAEEEVFADLLAEHLLDGLAGLDGVGVVMIDAEIGDAEAAQQVVAALLLRQAGSAVGRAAGIAGGIDVHGKNQPLRMNRSAASAPFS